MVDFFPNWKKRILRSDGFVVYLLLFIAASSAISCQAEVLPNTIYQFRVRGIDGTEVSLDRNKVVLIVNVASQCGLTHSNYAQLKELHEKYKEQGLAIALFPCNQFASQEPENEETIRRFVKETFNFEPDLYAKINVNGAEEHPLYTFLKSQKGGTLSDAIKWNFTKFLINRHGEVIERYAPTTQPKDIEEDIVKLLKEHFEL
uniref:Glutathione peroxidase n=1 Tax=Setaria digitata TaxID=48799 RepID=A0A915PZU9_9BILA